VMDCLDRDARLTSILLSDPARLLPHVDTALHHFQQAMWEDAANVTLVHGDPGTGSPPVWTLKTNIHARLHQLPIVPGGIGSSGRFVKRNLSCVQSCDIGQLVSIHGTVIRTGMIRVVESRREYECLKCQRRFHVYSDLDQGHTIAQPQSCPQRKCKGTKFQTRADGSVMRDYQRIKIQDAIMKLTPGTMPRSMVLALHDDLVDRCHAGDEIEVVGVVRAQWNGPLQRDLPCHADLYIDTVHLSVKQDRAAIGGGGEVGAEVARLYDTYAQDCQSYWIQAIRTSSQLHARNYIVTSFCPKLYGLFLVKLALLLTIIGGVPHRAPSGSSVRGECHLLMVGDAGTGKSQLLKYAAKLSPRSILTTGLGTTSAGLTVATAKEPGGEWALEAGALVLADGGVCCIDEFGCIRDHDRSTIHEAMEQQTVSVAKAGLVCTLQTRTTVLGAMNPKGSYDFDADLSVNTALATPLLSRFDLVLLLLDKQNKEWDRRVVDYIMDSLVRPIEEEVQDMSKERFKQEAQERKRMRQSEVNVRHTSSFRRNELEPWALERLQAYIQHVRRHFFPDLTPLAQRLLTRYYQYQRAADSRSAARTTIRLLESLVRLTQAHARLMWRHHATVQDAAMAVLVMETSLNACAIASARNSTLGSFATDVLHAVGTEHDLDARFPQQLSTLLARLDMRASDEERQAELDAEDENERALLGETDEWNARRAQRRLQHQNGEFIPAVKPTPLESKTWPGSIPSSSQTHSSDAGLFGQKTSNADASSATYPSVSSPPSKSKLAKPRSSKHSPLDHSKNLGVVYDPFSTATMHTSPIPAFTPSQTERGIAAAAATLSSEPSSTASAAAATRRRGATLGAKKRPRPITESEQSDEHLDDDSDEDQSVLILSQKINSKKKPQQRRQSAAQKRKMEAYHQRWNKSKVKREDEGDEDEEEKIKLKVSLPQPAPPPRPPPPPAPLSLDELLKSGFTSEQAANILSAPLRAAAFAPLATQSGGITRASTPNTATSTAASATTSSPAYNAKPLIPASASGSSLGERNGNASATAHASTSGAQRNTLPQSAPLLSPPPPLAFNSSPLLTIPSSNLTSSSFSSSSSSSSLPQSAAGAALMRMLQRTATAANT